MTTYTVNTAAVFGYSVVICFVMKKYKVVNKNKDFARAYNKGVSAGCRYCIVFYRKNGLRENRLGISTPRKVGNAVQRSRARRVIRAAFQGLMYEFPKGYDMIVCARPETAKCKSTDVSRFFSGRLIPQMKTGKKT